MCVGAALTGLWYTTTVVQGLFFDGTKGAALWENNLFIALFVLQKFGASGILPRAFECGAWPVLTLPRTCASTSCPVLLRDRHRRNGQDGPAEAVPKGPVGCTIPSTLVVDVVVHVGVAFDAVCHTQRDTRLNVHLRLERLLRHTHSKLHNSRRGYGRAESTARSMAAALSSMRHLHRNAMKSGSFQ